MNLVSWVEANSSQFGDQLKLALDFAQLLENPIFDLGTYRDKNARDVPDIALEKIKLFCCLNKICAKSEVNAPLPPREAFEAILRDKMMITPGVQNIINRLEFAKNGFKESSRCALVRDFIEICPGFLTGLSADQALAFINLFLMDFELGIIDWETPVIGDGTQGMEPSQPLNVLIVDDYLNEIVSTFCALAGWPNMTIDVRWIRAGWKDSPHAILAQESQEIRALNPDIVLMDQGLGPIKGSDLITQIRRDDPATKIIFVGNTGGNPDDLQNAGAIGNFEKGRAGVACINTAIRRAISR